MSDAVWAGLAGVLLLVAAACTRPEPAVPAEGALAAFSGLEGRIDIGGGTAHIPVMQEAARRIMTAYPRIAITIEGGGSGVGVKKVSEGLVHIGNTGRPLKNSEQEAAGLQSFAFAVDGVALCVHPDNPVASLTTAQARAIWGGSMTNWREVGGPDLAIQLYNRDEASGTREVFWEKLLAKGPIADRANVLASNGAMKVAVAHDRGALGYISIGHIDPTLKPVSLDAVEPTQENAVSGAYPVVRHLFMNTRGKPGPLVQAFINYIYSAEGAQIIQSAGYIPAPAPGGGPR
ncbi:MAG: phosphate ABC transporter substrate-binding protein [Planctomycetes bacterium]|nr:phosphate ABC transporter substrate-binding protein [Planctomycetota bacterium]